jgi:hypothetical protein
MRFGFNTKLTCLAALLGAGLTISSHAMAKEEEIGDDGYNKTYDDPNKSFKTRMKESRTTPEATVDNSKGGLFLGINGHFGPVYDAEPKSSSGMGFGFGVEPGYVIQSGNWNRLELSLLVAYQSFTWKGGEKIDSTMTPLSFTPRFGYGFNLGDNLSGILRVGFGMATGQVTQKGEAIETSPLKASSAKTDSKMGFVFSGDYDIVYGKDKVQFAGGLGVTHYQYAFSKLGSADYDSKLNLNHVNLHGGVRFAF